MTSQPNVSSPEEKLSGEDSKSLESSSSDANAIELLVDDNELTCGAYNA